MAIALSFSGLTINSIVAAHLSPTQSAKLLFPHFSGSCPCLLTLFTMKRFVWAGTCRNSGDILAAESDRLFGCDQHPSALLPPIITRVGPQHSCCGHQRFPLLAVGPKAICNGDSTHLSIFPEDQTRRCLLKAGYNLICPLESWSVRCTASASKLATLTLLTSARPPGIALVVAKFYYTLSGEGMKANVFVLRYLD